MSAARSSRNNSSSSTGTVVECHSSWISGSIETSYTGSRLKITSSPVSTFRSSQPPPSATIAYASASTPGYASRKSRTRTPSGVSLSSRSKSALLSRLNSGRYSSFSPSPRSSTRRCCFSSSNNPPSLTSTPHSPNSSSGESARRSLMSVSSTSLSRPPKLTGAAALSAAVAGLTPPPLARFAAPPAPAGSPATSSAFRFPLSFLPLSFSPAFASSSTLDAFSSCFRYFSRAF
mmetsp:Transcript_28250/g.92208  ORF Transcript_28250/g.92208 Transcript_28250/m.92208 type:complete len:233 (+) Transcript_28250:246-944(+)